MFCLKKSVLCAAATLCIGLNLSAELIKLDDVGVTFEIPDAFTFFLSKDEISKYLHTRYSPETKIPDIMGDEKREFIVTYRTYVSTGARHRANLKKEKKDIEAGLKKRGANIIKSAMSKDKEQERLSIEYINSFKLHNYSFYVENTKDKSVLFIEISVKEENLEKFKDEIQKCVDSIKNK